jgi:hypothetical protein
MVAGKQFLIFPLLLIGALSLVSCIAIPTPPHGLGVVPDKEALESLRPGEATLADILLLLGEPKYRLEDDHFLMYEWMVAYGYVAVGMYGAGTAFPVAAPHYLCLEFGPGSRLVRLERFSVSPSAKLNEATMRCIKPTEEPDDARDKK